MSSKSEIEQGKTGSLTIKFSEPIIGTRFQKLIQNNLKFENTLYPSTVMKYQELGPKSFRILYLL